jgi:hypothetical protein
MRALTVSAVVCVRCGCFPLLLFVLRAAFRLLSYGGY